ncbi:MAG TPA: SRPBCC domain-containing protein [Devosia sp.]|nr:SRPBCC domain-containing protein [Devosia sp.]
MSEPAAETRSVIVEREMAASPEKLWRALTQPHLIAEWLMDNDFELATGHKFTLRRNPTPEVSVVIACEVLKAEPNRMLSYSWSAYGLDSIVTFTLTPTVSGTLLRVEQAGFPQNQRAAYKGAKASWPMFLGELERVAADLA